jgi:hypothetical protein
MLTIEQFKAALSCSNALEIVDGLLLPNPPKHVTPENLDFLSKTVAASYGVSADQVEVIITGSANLGFSLSEKRDNGAVIGERYRLFSAASDIDVAVISPPIFDAIWQELSASAAGASMFPPREGKLGDYMVSGWLRPDHFPRNRRLLRCDNWFDTIRRINTANRFSRRRVNGGLFFSRHHLRHYMTRAVSDCMRERGVR